MKQRLARLYLLAHPKGPKGSDDPYQPQRSQSPAATGGV